MELQQGGRSEEQRATSLEKGGSIGILDSLGLKQQTAQYIGAMNTIAVGFTICLSWAGVATTLGLAIVAGGFVTVIYGIILIFIVFGCIIGTLAELASVYPTAGGQYHWANILAPESFARAISYACGTVNMFSWIAICAGVCSIIPELVLQLAIQYNPTYLPEPWHFFLVYEAFNLLCLMLNIFVIRRATWLYTFGLFLSILSIIIIMVTCLARAEVFQPNHVVWTDFTNETGWTSSGVVFFIGLIVPNYMYAGIDGAIHLAEECINATVDVPRALISTWLIGFVSTFVFIIAMAYTVQDLQAVLESLFPIYEVWVQATRSPTAATIFTVVLGIIGTIATAGCYQTASRLTWSLARDNALLGSKYIGRMHPKLEVPVWSILVNGLLIFIIGCIYLGSTTAFQACLASGIVLNLLTFSFPAAMILLRRRSDRFLPSNRAFKLPSVVGWVANCITLVFPFVTLIFYSFPTVLPVTPSNMNYTSAVIGVMAIFAALNWFVWASKNYVGPTIQKS